MTLPGAPPSPYKGLAPFEDSETDALLFFGRERDIEVIAANVTASRLTMLFGPSGVGKSSILRAGVARRLRELPDVAVVTHDRWSNDPLKSLRRALAAPGDAALPAGSSLADGVETWTRRRDSDVFLLLDQFEELFAYRGADEARGVTDQIAELAARPGLRVNVLVAVRDDALASLDILTGRVPSVFGNYLRLDRLDAGAARRAIEAPLDRWNRLAGAVIEVEPALVDAVVAGTEAADGVEAPYLQLVLQRVWEVESAAGSSVLRLSTLEALGGPRSVVREHLGRAMDTLTAGGREVAARVFTHLVTPSGTKIAHRLSDLAAYGAVPASELAPVLHSLSHHRILRPLEGDRYEIFHDVLAEPVLAWQAAHTAEARVQHERRRHRRLLVAAVGALVLLALVSAVAVYAVAQRGEAREQARSARAHALTAAARANLDTDPELAMLLSLEAAALQRSSDVEDVLRRSLERSRVRRVLPASARPAELNRDRRVDRAAGIVARASGGRVDLRGGGTPRRVLHRARVRAVDLDAAGTLLAVASGHSAFVWDATTGRLRAELLGHTADVVDVSISPDRSFVATASLDSTARLWNADTGAQIDILFGHDNFLTAVEFSPDGATLLTASRDATARLWEPGTGRPLAILAGHRGAVTAAAYTANGRVITTTGEDATVRRWNALPEPVLTRGELAPPLPTLKARGASGRSATAQGETVRLTGGGAPERRLVGHTQPITSVSFSEDAKLVVTASLDKDARIWDAESGAPLQLLRRHFGPVAAASFSPDSRWVVTAGPISAGLWETSSGRFLFYLRGHRDNLTAAGFTPDGRTIITVDRGGNRMMYRCRVCGSLPDLVALAKQRLRGTGRELTAAERRRFLP